MQSIATDELNEQPSELEQAVSLISKSASHSEVGAAQALTVRLPVLVFATIRAFSEHSGQSMNKITGQLLRVAIDAVQEELPPEDANAIARMRNMICAELLHPGQTSLQLEGDE